MPRGADIECTFGDGWRSRDALTQWFILGDDLGTRRAGLDDGHRAVLERREINMAAGRDGRRIVRTTGSGTFLIDLVTGLDVVCGDHAAIANHHILPTIS